MNRHTNQPELLIPAGGTDALHVAVDCGADAVYLGGSAFSLRGKAENFSREEMADGIAFAHENGVKVYVTVNAFAHEPDLADIEAYLAVLALLTPDALIIADPGVFAMARRICPRIPVHISTQANNLNHETCLFWYGLGVKRIVLAREMTLADIRAVRSAIPEDMEIECFVHGAVCMAYSGRCHMSAYLAGRDANTGFCTQSCRWNYTVVEEKRPGQFMPVEETEAGTQIFAANDLCMVAHIPELVRAGIDAFKVEGRTKTATYVRKVTETYRSAIDDYFKDVTLYEANIPRYLEQLREGASRPFDTGFYFGQAEGSFGHAEGSTA
ncbi:MAG: U32 family peptidase [Lachnospiraceae bacterium]|nr:U32 family peptidase [Lachnospiraceae bacterium]